MYIFYKLWPLSKIFQTGDKVAFYETNQIREGSFLCALDNLDPAIILEDVLNNEEDLKFFCRNNNLKMTNIIV